MQFNTHPRTAQLLMIVFAVVCLAVGVALIAGSAQAAETPQNNTTSDSTGEQIQDGLTLVSSSYDGNGSATVTLRAETYETVTITDAGAFASGGEIPRRVVVLDPGETTVEMPVTESGSGLVGVTIGTNETLYAEPIVANQTQDDGLFDRSATWTAVQYGSAGGAVGVILIALGIVYNIRRGGRNRVERKA
jgi:ABC-type Fe3+-hydroxamate transport system substrate-binding protein